MENLDWTTFNRRISIAATPVTVFKSWTTQENLEKWFLSSAEFLSKDDEKRDRFSKIEVGDKYKWMWHGSDFIAEGEVLENNKTDFLKFTFLGCDVEVMLKTENEKLIVELTQSNIPLDETSRMDLHVGCSGGWTFFMTNLKSILEGGIDLRNKDINLVDVINT